MFEVSKSAVNQPAGPARRAIADVALLNEAGTNATRCRIPRDAGAVDPAADNDQVIRIGVRHRFLYSWPGLTAPANDVFEARQLLRPDRPARMNTARRNADLGAHSELAAIRELSRRVVQQNRAVDDRERIFRRPAESSAQMASVWPEP